MTKGWLKTFIRRKLVRLHDSMIKLMIYEILSYACCSGLITSFFFHVCPWSMKLFTLHCRCFTLCVDDCGKSRDLITTRSESDFFRDELYWRWLLEVWQKKICSMSNTLRLLCSVFLATQPLSDGNNKYHSCKFNFFFFSAQFVPQKIFSLANECKFQSRCSYSHESFKAF